MIENDGANSMFCEKVNKAIMGYLENTLGLATIMVLEHHAIYESGCIADLFCNAEKASGILEEIFGSAGIVLEKYCINAVYEAFGAMPSRNNLSLGEALEELKNQVG